MRQLCAYSAEQHIAGSCVYCVCAQAPWVITRSCQTAGEGSPAAAIADRQVKPRRVRVEGRATGR